MAIRIVPGTGRVLRTARCVVVSVGPVPGLYQKLRAGDVAGTDAFKDLAAYIIEHDFDTGPIAALLTSGQRSAFLFGDIAMSVGRDSRVLSGASASTWNEVALSDQEWQKVTAGEVGAADDTDLELGSVPGSGFRWDASTAELTTSPSVATAPGPTTGPRPATSARTAGRTPDPAEAKDRASRTGGGRAPSQAQASSRGPAPSGIRNSTADAPPPVDMSARQGTAGDGNGAGPAAQPATNGNGRDERWFDTATVEAQRPPPPKPASNRQRPTGPAARSLDEFDPDGADADSRHPPTLSVDTLAFDHRDDTLTPLEPRRFTPSEMRRAEALLLRLDDGHVIELTQSIYVGRFPQKGRLPSGYGALAVNGEHVSRRHWELIVDGPELLVRDLNSTSGTSIQGPDDTTLIPVPNEDPMPIEVGTTIHFADRSAIIEIETG